jgi:hypothetical protein
MNTYLDRLINREVNGQIGKQNEKRKMDGDGGNVNSFT